VIELTLLDVYTFTCTKFTCLGSFPSPPSCKVPDLDAINTNVVQSPPDLYTTHVARIDYMSSRRRHELPTACQRR